MSDPLAPDPADARPDDPERQALRARLEASRTALLVALEGVTEREFATRLEDGETVVHLLARLAAEERTDALALHGRTEAATVAERPLPPQVVHALAGARYQTLRALDADGVDAEAAARLVERIEAREREAAERIRARPAPAPVPVIPVIQPPEG